MADISKIKLPNGNEYKLKDTNAPRGGATLGVQEVLNPFAPGKETELIKTDRLDNAFYFADKRWNVTATMVNITTGAETPITNLNLIASLFNMSEDAGFIINSNYRAVITIDFTGSDGTSVFKNYPYGYVYVNFYYTGGPKSMSARVYGKHTGNEPYWLTLYPSADPRNTNTAIRYIISQNGMYNMQKLEISVDGSDDTTKPTRLSEISYYLTRADKNHDMPYISKLREETLYYALTGPDFIGKINGHTVNKDVPSDAVFTDTTYTAATAAPEKVASTSATGTSINYARQDHTHGIDLATGDANGQIKIAGTNVSVKGLGALAYQDNVTVTKADVGLDKVENIRLTGIVPVKGTQTKATASWTGNISISALYDGLTIAYYLPYAGTSTSATLKLTLSDNSQTAAIPVYYTATSRATTQYGAGSTIILTYWGAGSISVSGTATDSARWTRCDYNYNSDTKVRQTLSTSNVNHPLLMGYSDNTTTTGNVDNVSYRNNSIFANPSTGKITATGFVGNVEGTLNNHVLNTDVPSDAVFTDTTYEVATTSTNGLMSSTDKLRLERIGGTYDVGTETITFEFEPAPDIEHITSSADFRVQLLQALQNVAWINNNGNTYYTNLMNALYPSTQAYITVSYTQSGTVFTDDSLDILKSDLTVTYYSEPGATGVVLNDADYDLSGTLTTGSNTITVTYAIYTETFTVSNVLTNLAASFNNWTMSYDAANTPTITISDGVLTIGCATQAQYNEWSIWIADCKQTLWSSVVNKTAHFRIKAKKRTNTQSDGRLQITATCFANASVTSMANANRKSAVLNAMIPNNTNMTIYDGTFSVVFSNLNQGSLSAPTSSSTFGLLIYAWTMDYFDIYEAKMGVSQ